MFLKKAISIFVKSGITISNKNVSLFFLKNKFLLKSLRFKIDPEILIKNKFNQKEFSLVISEISIGPAFKTTGYERHNFSDNIIFDYLQKFPSKRNFADIGVSDGTSAMYLIKKIKKGNFNTNIKLYDKYTHLNLIRKWMLRAYSNTDNELVYIKAFFFIFYVYPLNISIKSTIKEKVYFDNPVLKINNLIVEYSDVFTTKFNIPVDFIKCANILNPVYFSPEEIKQALRNIHCNLNQDGYLFIIHNTKELESLVVFKKTQQTLVVEKIIKNDGFLRYIQIRGNVFYIK